MQTEIQKRTNAALIAIKNDFSQSGDETATQLFVAHHLDEIEASYWQAQLNSAKPAAESVLDLLVLKVHWAVKAGDIDENGIDTFDFTLPDNVTQYVLSVRFDETGEIESIDMES